MSAGATVSTASAAASAAIVALNMSCNNCCINEHVSSVINLKVMVFRIFCTANCHSCLGIMHHCKNDHHWVKQQYLPDALKDVKYYTYGDNRTEQAARAYWAKIKGEENV